MSRRKQPRHRTTSARDSSAIWISIGLIVLTIAVFFQVRHFEFVTLDDPIYVSENPHIADGITARSVAWAFTTSQAANWHPITWLSHVVDVQLFGLNAGAHHLTSALLHLVNTLILFWLLFHLTGAAGRSGFVAAVFAVHPLHVESVAWVAERKDVLSTLFWLLTLWAYVRYTRTRTTSRYAVMTAMFALGLMAKPMLVTVPVTLLLLDVWPLARWQRRADAWPLVREKLPLLALSVAAAVVTFLVQARGGAVSTLTDIPLAERISNALHSYIAYLGLMFWPVNLAGFYPLRLDTSPSQVITAIIVLLGVSMASIRFTRRAPYFFMGWGWFIVTLLPVIGLVQVGVQAMADRYTYVPLIGIAVAVAWAAGDLLSRYPGARRFLPVTAGALVVVLAVGARAQAQHWRNSTAFWTRAATASFGVTDYRAHLELGRVLLAQDRTAEAADHYLKAVELQPASPEAHHGLGLVRLAQGDATRAVSSLEEAAKNQPASAEILNDLGWALLKAGRVADARARLTEAVRLRPAFAGAYANLGLSYALEGQLGDAVPHFREAVRLDPGFENARINLGRALASLGRQDEAIRELEEALRRNPASEPARRLLEQIRGRK